MKLTFALLALALSFSACSHKQVRSNDNQVSTATAAPTTPDQNGTVSGAPTSLGAATSGRGH